MAGALSRLVARGRALSWMRIYSIGRWVYARGSGAFRALEEPERRRLGELLRKSRGRRSNLTERERAELRGIVAKALEGARISPS